MAMGRFLINGQVRNFLGSVLADLFGILASGLKVRPNGLDQPEAALWPIGCIRGGVGQGFSL
jgi:hypothetical protein